MILLTRALIPLGRGHVSAHKPSAPRIRAWQLFHRLLGWRTRITALFSGVLCLLFALTMTVALGIKAPLDASVFVGAGAGFLLAICAEYPFSIDHLRSRGQVRMESLT